MIESHSLNENIQAEIDRMQQEFTEGENELLRLRQRIMFLETQLQRIDGGITALRVIQKKIADEC